MLISYSRFYFILENISQTDEDLVVFRSGTSNSPAESCILLVATEIDHALVGEAQSAEVEAAICRRDCLANSQLLHVKMITRRLVSLFVVISQVT